MTTPPPPPPLDLDEAATLDAADPLAGLRDEFEFPPGPDGTPQAYFAGNSLGLLPRRARDRLDAVLRDWSELAVRGHFTDPDSWYRYDEPVAALQQSLVGAKPEELGLMGSLTTNLHLLMASFYRPQLRRRQILIEPHAFPSDRYAVASQVAWHGGDPMTDVIVVQAADPDHVTLEDLDRTLEAHGKTIAMALVGGVNYYTGQLLDIAAWTERLRAHDIVVGFDLAHAAGNVPVDLHGAGVDFAAWCTYKYLNGGPGSTSGYFVHERHLADTERIRLAGWWGNDPETRFDMHGQERFIPRLTADSWKTSNPSILAMAPVRASLELFDEVGIDVLRERSLRLTAFLERGMSAIDRVKMITPRSPDARGCQLSLRVPGDASAIEATLAEHGVICDARDPDILRFAPAPLYTSFTDVARATNALATVLA